MNTRIKLFSQEQEFIMLPNKEPLKVLYHLEIHSVDFFSQALINKPPFLLIAYTIFNIFQQV